MENSELETIIGRRNNPIDNSTDLLYLKNTRILITGAKGSLRAEVVKIFLENKIFYLATDIDTCDVRDFNQVLRTIKNFEPTHILHLAADKHAPEGELNPFETFNINTLGTVNLIKASQDYGSEQFIDIKIVLSSTCKSCDPETVYGSSKLIAERLILNSGGTVARFFNVVETSANVFEIWKNSPNLESLNVTNCYRYFMSATEAVSLLIKSLVLADDSPGRYIFNPGVSHFMPDIAKRIYPKRIMNIIPPRRGDRLVEPIKATSERLIPVTPQLLKVESPHDPPTP